MEISRVKSRAALALVLHLYLNGTASLADGEACALLGITSRTSVWSARKELVELGYITAERSPSGYVYRLTEPVSQEPAIEQEEEPIEIDPLDKLAADIDAMDATGTAHQPYSPAGRRRIKLMGFIERVMNTVLPEEKPFKEEQRRALAAAAEKNTAAEMGPAMLLLTMIRRYSVGNVEKFRPNMFAYINKMVTTEGTEAAPKPPQQQQQQQPRPPFKKPFNGNEDGLSDDELRKIQLQHIEADRVKYAHLLKLPRKRPKWQLEEGE
ncbi:hypothetical protein [Ktedonobacter robiniae]|uniref:Helix-turn-helix domain-containing protein n=1 Tax=Ktedonobacter robiniae TaxID=2778365 RepID=A0ABQ3USY1_9CHLR|nr:hypothetical protein [Ktedonobacter robiniae]GHO55495.1 hypothetical protein KSB_39700 [Ktedonobacter robiniae]